MANTFEGGKSPAIKISQKWLRFYQSFCKRGQTQVESCELFDKYTNLYTLCSVIGYNIGHKTPLESQTASPFTLEQVGETYEWTTLIAIAYADTNQDDSVFMDSRRILNICDEYAETGIRWIIEQYPFNIIYKDGNIYNYDKIDLEQQVMLLIRQQKSEHALI